MAVTATTSYDIYGKNYIEGVCLSRDDKPTEGIQNGSKLWRLIHRLCISLTPLTRSGGHGYD